MKTWQIQTVTKFVIYDGAKIVFQSYESIIVEVNNDTKTITFGRDWDYSRTTRKYRNMFFNDYIYELSTLDNKKCVEAAINDGFVFDKIGRQWTVRFDKAL